MGVTPQQSPGNPDWFSTNSKRIALLADQAPTKLGVKKLLFLLQPWAKKEGDHADRGRVCFVETDFPPRLNGFGCWNTHKFEKIRTEAN